MDNSLPTWRHHGFAAPASLRPLSPVADDLAARIDALAQLLATTAAARDQAGGTAWAEHQALRDSGLLALAVPTAYGGLGADWPTVLRAVRRLAQADSSLAHLFGFQHVQVGTVLLFASPPQQQDLLTRTVQQRWFWGNAVNARDTRLQVQATDGGWTLQGLKGFCSGARGAQQLIVSFATGPAPTERHYAAIPADRPGLTAHDDWDNMGQRQTDSGSVQFEQVAIATAEVLGPPGPASRPRATLRNMLSQLVLTEVYLGNALGALDTGVQLLQTQVQPWAMAQVAHAVDDPLLQLSTGRMAIALRSAQALADQALAAFQQAWDAGEALDWPQRAAVGMEVAAARAHAGEVALQVCAQMFELVGARGTTRALALDRYWRNVRVHTLHDPLDWRRSAVGRWLLTEAAPEAYGYG